MSYPITQIFDRFMFTYQIDSINNTSSGPSSFGAIGLLFETKESKIKTFLGINIKD